LVDKGNEKIRLRLRLRPRKKIKGGRGRMAEGAEEA
jgi:hypothetical protein